MKFIPTFLILILAGSSFGQTTGPGAYLESILVSAEKQTQNYREAFKNLLSEETKTFEIFDKNGNVKKRTVVESNFMIFESLKDESVSSEYRDVIKVDGKAVGKTEERSADLFEQLAKAKSVRQELEKIQKENSRYDKNLHINGLTLFQAPVLAENLRPYFEFKVSEQENSGGVYVLEYQQTKPSPYILFEEKADDDRKISLKYDLDLPRNVNRSSVLLRGKLWIDGQTFQIRREERELIANMKNDSNPLVFFREEYEYQPSDFEILVPKKIVYTYFKVKSDNGIVSSNAEVKATFEYGKFRKSRVEIKIDDDTENPQ